MVLYTQFDRKQCSSVSVCRKNEFREQTSDQLIHSLLSISQDDLSEIMYVSLPP